MLPVAAHADCPGQLPDATTCSYTSAGEVGQRSAGVLRFPQAVAIGPDGAIYVADQKSHTIQIFNPDGSFRGDIGVAGTKPGQLSSVGGVAVAPDGSVFAAAGANRIDRFSAGGQLLKSFGKTGSEVGQFAFGAGGGNDAGAGGGVAIGPDGMLYVADSGNDRVQRFDLDGGGGAQIVAPGTLAYPMGLTVRKTRLFVADNQNHRVVVFDLGGRQLQTIGAGKGGRPGQLEHPYDVAADASGRVFVADDINHRVVRFSTLPNYVYKARWGSYGQGPGQLAYPRGIATDANGLVYVANTGNDRVDVFDNGGRLVRTMGRSGRATGQFDEPTGIGADASGIRAVTDAVNGRVQLLGPSGNVIAVWGSPNPGPTILPDPVAVAFDAAGNAYVLDGRRSRIIVFSRATGQPVRTIASEGSGPGKLLDPSALAMTPGGTIVVADTGNERLARFRSDGTYLGAQTDVGDVRGVAITPDGARTYASTGSNRRIRAYSPSGDLLAEFGGLGHTIGKLDAPEQIALDPAGNLWVADRGNSRVQQFGPDGERLASFGQRGTGVGQFIRPTGVSVDCTDEQKAITEMVRQFADEQIIPNAEHYDHEDEFPEADRRADEGARPLRAHDPRGVRRHGRVDLTTYAMVVEELSRGWISISGVVNTHFIGSYLLMKFGTDEQKQKYLPRMATGEIRAALLDVRARGWAPTSRRSRRPAKKGDDGDEYEINGQKMWVTNGLRSGLVFVLVKTDPTPTRLQGHDLLHRREGAGGFGTGDRASRPAQDREDGLQGRRVHRAGLRRLPDPATNILGGEEAGLGKGFYQMMDGSRSAASTSPPAACGIAQRALRARACATPSSARRSASRSPSTRRSSSSSPRWPPRSRPPA
jgi:tripartite motif-containing protein 71